jgi:hypothetical protein
MTRLRSHMLLQLLLLSALVLPAAPAFAQGAGPALDQWRSGQPAVNDTFARNNGRWELTSDDDVVRELRDGALYVAVRPKDFIGWAGFDGEYKDFYLEVDATHLTGPVVNIMGILFRKQDDDNFYMAMISSDGYAAVGKWTTDAVSWLHDWEQTNAVSRGEAVENRIGVLAVGRDIVMLVNDEEVVRVRDTTFAAGGIALLAGTNKDEGDLEVSFDNLQIWTQARTPARRSIGGANTRSTPSSPTPAATPRRSLGPSATAPGEATPTPRSLNPGSTPTAPSADAAVNSDTLNVRAGPGTNYRVIGQLKLGDNVRITGRLQNNSWVKIVVAGQAQAWVSTQFLDVYVDLAQVPLAAAPAAPPQPSQAARKNVAYLVIENHIGRYLTVQVNDKNFRVEGKTGSVPGRYQFVLEGTGWYTVAAQLPNGGSHNWDLYVEPTADKCAGRTGCVALGQTYLQTYY